MGDSGAGNAGERFIAEFGEDYRRVSGLDGDRMYIIEKHGLVYDDFHREVKYAVTLRPAKFSEPGEKLEVILDEPAAYDPECGTYDDEIDRTARALGISIQEVLARFKRAGLVPEDYEIEVKEGADG